MPGINRKEFIKISATALSGGLALAVTSLYLSNEIEELEIVRISIPIKDLPSSFDGFRIVQISDIHLYPLTKLELVQQAVQIANQLNPDLHVLTGDYVWHEVEAIYDLAPVLANLKSRHGVYAILGNHEVWTNANVVLNALKENGLPVLINQGITLTEGRSQIYLAGLDDGWSGKPDLQMALADAPKDIPIVLLYHEPDLADSVALDRRIALQLSGHSHGGQVRFPVVGAPLLPYLAWKYDMGLYRIQDLWLYTNRGIGVTNIPVRYNCPPEITEITLVRA